MTCRNLGLCAASATSELNDTDSWRTCRRTWLRSHTLWTFPTKSKTITLSGILSQSSEFTPCALENQWNAELLGR